MIKANVFIVLLLSLVLSACGQAASTPEAVEPTQVLAPTQTREVVVEPTQAPTDTPAPSPIPPTPTEAPPPPGSNAPSEEELAGTITIGELLAPDEGSLKVFTDKNIKQFASELRASGLFLWLSEQGPFTVFAPEYVFEDIPQGTFTTSDQFMEALKSHIVPGWYFEEDLVAMDGQSIPTLAEGVNIQITVKDGVVYINDVAMMQQADILARNGVIHVIDQFLMPPGE